MTVDISLLMGDELTQTMAVGVLVKRGTPLSEALKVIETHDLTVKYKTVPDGAKSSTLMACLVITPKEQEARPTVVSEAPASKKSI